MEQELPTLPEHISSPPVFSWVHVTRSLVICVCFVDRCLSFYPFVLSWCCLSFDLRILITLWYLQALLSCPDIPSNGGGRTASHPRRLGVPMLFIEVRVDQSFVYCVSLFVFLSPILLALVLTVLQFATSGFLIMITTICENKCIVRNVISEMRHAHWIRCLHLYC